MIEIALGIVLAVILLSTIEYWFPVVVWTVGLIALLVVVLFLFALAQ